MNKNGFESVYAHITANRGKYIIVLISLFISITSGAIIGINANSFSDKSDFLTDFISVYKLQGITYSDVFVNSLISNLRMLIVLWLSGLYIWLIPVNIISVSAKGFGIGYAVAYFISCSGLKGFCFAFITMFFQNVITIPLMLVYSVLQIIFSMKVYRLKRGSSNYRQIRKLRINNVILFIISIILCICCSMFEAGITPSLIKLIYGNFA